MFLNELEGQIKTQNIGEIKTYQVAANSVIFKMLSSDIYSDKIRAVIRELSTNAYDAMVEYGTIKPNDLENSLKFKVHLPTYLEPYFSIRDFGPGLDEEGIIYVYTYGASTRRKSNEFAGVLGIGAKSPHAYSKSGFNVNSYFNGKMFSYVSFLKDGEPSFVLNDETFTAEPNGVEVIINVNSNDIDAFRRKAKEVYMWFNHKPEFNIDIAFDKYILIEDSDDYAIFQIKNEYRDEFTKGILMGNILYEYPDIIRSTYNSHEQKIMDRVVFKADIGDVDFHPSREYLDDSTKTKGFIDAKIKGFLKKVVQDINAKVQDLYKDPTISYFEKSKKIHTSLNTFKGIFNQSEVRELSVKKFGRLKVLEKRAESVLKRLPWLDSLMYRNLNKSVGERQRQFYLNDDIIVMDKPLSYDNIFKWLRKNVNPSISNIKVFVPKYSYFPKLSNGRYDYDHIHNVTKVDIMRYFRCKETEIRFTSQMITDIGVKAPITRAKKSDPKILKIPYLDLSKSWWNLIRDTRNEFDVKNPPEKIYYIRLNNMFNKLISLGDGTSLQWKETEKFYDEFRSYLKRCGIVDIKLHLAYPSMITDLMLKHPNYVDVIELVKASRTPIKKYDKTKLQNFKSTLLTYYSSDSSSYFKQNQVFKSKLYKLINDDKDFMKKLIETKSDSEEMSYTMLGLLPIYEEEVCELPAWYADYCLKYGDLEKYIYDMKDRYWDCHKIDLLIHLFETAIENGKL